MELLVIIFISIFFISIFSWFIPWDSIYDRRALPHRHRRKRKGWWPWSKAKEPRALPSRNQPSDQPRTKLSLQTLEVGDVVSYLHRDFVVEECRIVREDKLQWREYSLNEGTMTYNLSVDADEKEIFLLKPIELVVDYPPPNNLEYKGESYKLVSAGQAELAHSRNRFKYFTYDGPEPYVIVVEDWGKGLESYLGEQLNTTDLDLLPGSPISAKK